VTDGEKEMRNILPTQLSYAVIEEFEDRGEQPEQVHPTDVRCTQHANT
jgi:hypothetical protein